jgi:hypothetical protein
MSNLQLLNRGNFMKSRNRAVTPKKTKTTARTGPAGEEPQKTTEIEPAGPDSGLDVWISAQQASDILGVQRTAIYRLVDAAKPFLIMRRPLPRKVLVSLRSVQAFAQATKDPMFWTSTDLQEEHLKKLKEIPNG